VPDHRIPEPDQSLLARVAQGDAEALAQLQQRHGGTVYALAYGILIDAVQADEVVAETFAFAWQRAAQVTESLTGSVFGWLTGIARSQARALLQSRDWPVRWFPAGRSRLHQTVGAS
jgi:DNA-directed RNA polymerase specialized sigma24 family protein